MKYKKNKKQKKNKELYWCDNCQDYHGEGWDY